MRINGLQADESVSEEVLRCLGPLGIEAALAALEMHSGAEDEVDTALNTIIEACDRITDTARSRHRAFIVEVMGRHSGYLAMASAVAAAADGVLLPEHQRSREEILTAVTQCVGTYQSDPRTSARTLIIKAGVPITTADFVQEVVDRLGPDSNVEVRGTVLGHLVRGGTPASVTGCWQGVGLVAVQASVAGATDRMAGWNLTESGDPTSDSWIRLFSFRRGPQRVRGLHGRNQSGDDG